jgi:cell division septation protein DedD
MRYALHGLVAAALLIFASGPLSAADNPAKILAAWGPVDSAPAGPDPAESDSSSEKSLRAGIRAYVTGDFKLAVPLLGVALQGSLSSDQAARALFYRGLAYRKQGMPGRALSDLTRALQQADGLSAAERSDAEENRIAASQEAGLPSVDSVVVPRVATESVQEPVAALPVSAPAATPAASKSTVTGSVAPAPVESKLTVTGSVAPAVETQPIGSNWSDTAQVTMAELPPPTPVATVPVAEAPVGPPKDFHLQIATVSSRSEAFALSVRLTSQYGSEFGRRRLVVSEMQGENQARAYRVRLGPYANAEEPQRVCDSLHAGGYECLVE